MSKPLLDTQPNDLNAARPVVLEITVRNHAGVMSHVCGLFARRAFNVDGILCMPVEARPTVSRIWLLVKEDPRLNQMLEQVRKLIDVIDVCRSEAGHDVFVKLEAFFTGASASVG